MRFFKRLWSEEKGEDMTEYALIVGLVAIAAVVAMTALGGTFNGWFSALDTKIANIAPAP
ncbi:MAG: Flp family type IVb pilin [Dehalococcoidia bacterium]|nr:Flp family type IVb pilin [Dehalococcoidia bacterium]